MVGLDQASNASQCTNFTSTTVMRGLGRHFINSYESYCKRNHSHPLKEVKVASSSVKGTIDLIVDKIKFNDWIPLLKAVSGDRSLHSISFKSRIHQGSINEDITTDRQARDAKKGPVLFTAFMLQKFIDACSDCLEHSKTLRMFQLEKIPLTLDFVNYLSLGVVKTSCLQKLILVGCHLGDEGCLRITEAVKKIPSIRILDLSSNDITSAGAKQIANLIKFQDITRYNECWKHSLRSREVNTEAIPGLRRFSINDNHEVRDKGLKYIIDALYDDVWIKAIDMQNCGITDWGCSIVQKLLDTNQEIVVFDLRKNDIVDMTAIASIISILGTHTKEDDITEFGWMAIDSPLSGSSEDSSSGSGSCSSYNLAYSNAKVAKYVETTANMGQPPLRAIQSAATLTSIAEKTRGPQHQVKFQKPIQRFNSTSRMRPSNYEETAIATKKKLVSSGHNSRVNRPNALGKLSKGINQQGSRRRISPDNMPNSKIKGTSLRATRSDERVSAKTFTCAQTNYLNDYDSDQSIVSKESGDVDIKSDKRNERVSKSKTILREEVTKQTLEVGKTLGKSSGSLVESHTAFDSSEKIEHALQQLFKSFEEATIEKPESKSSMNRLSYDLTPSLSIEDFKNDSIGFRKPNRRIKETKQVCCLYFNRLEDEDGYDE